MIPLYDRIVIELEDKQEISSKTGLTYTQNMSLSNNTVMKGKVVAVGSGKLLQNGETIPLKVAIGDTVLYSKMQGENYNDGKTDYTILSESCILAIIRE